MNFADYKTASRYAASINAGYSGRLTGKGRDSNPHAAGADQAAWWHGWDEADKSASESRGEGE